MEAARIPGSAGAALCARRPSRSPWSSSGPRDDVDEEGDLFALDGGLGLEWPQASVLAIDRPAHPAASPSASPRLASFSLADHRVRYSDEILDLAHDKGIADTSNDVIVR